MKGDFSEETINIIIKWLRITEQKIASQNNQNNKENTSHIGKAIAAIYQLKKKEKTVNIPESDHLQVSEDWTDLVLDDLFSFNNMGAEYICSITEATIKVNGLKKKLSHISNYPMFFSWRAYIWMGFGI